ncbi:hypothetical protein WDV93_24925 [Pantoea ananatis]
MKTQITRTVTEAAVIFAAFVWVVATGWLFLFSSVTEPPLPPPQVARFFDERQDAEPFRLAAGASSVVVSLAGL